MLTRTPHWSGLQPAKEKVHLPFRILGSGRQLYIFKPVFSLTKIGTVPEEDKKRRLKMRKHICQQCGCIWHDPWIVSTCPTCESCDHDYQITRGECFWCFGPMESCPCGSTKQNHEPWCPEDRTLGWELVGVGSLRRFDVADRQAILHLESSDIIIATSPKDLWQFAVWVNTQATETTKISAKLLAGIQEQGESV